MTQPGIELRPPGPLANTLLIRPMAQEYNYTGQQKKIFEMVLKHQTSFSANLSVLNLKMTLLFLG